MNSIHEQHIRESTINLQSQVVVWIDHKISKETEIPCSLRDGFEIVDDYLKHGESGLALEHLIYMIHETDIQVSDIIKSNLRNAAEAMNMQAVREQLL